MNEDGPIDGDLIGYTASLKRVLGLTVATTVECILHPQLSKVVEKTMGTLLNPFLELNDAYGPHQYAYKNGKG